MLLLSSRISLYRDSHLFQSTQWKALLRICKHWIQGNVRNDVRKKARLGCWLLDCCACGVCPSGFRRLMIIIVGAELWLVVSDIGDVLSLTISDQFAGCFRYGCQPCTAQVSLSDLRMPLIWRDTDHFKNKGDYRRFAVFCLARIGTEIYDTTLLCPVDRSLTDLTFPDVLVL